MKRRAIKLSDYLKSSEGKRDRDKGKRERNVVEETSNVKGHVSEQCRGSNVKPSDKKEWNLSESEYCETYGVVKSDQPDEGQSSDPIHEINPTSEVTSNPLMNMKRINYDGAEKGEYIHNE